MSIEDKPPGANGQLPEERGEHTGRVKRIVHEEMETLNGKLEHGEQLAKRLQFWGGLAVAIFLAGVGTILFLTARFAAAADVEKISTAQEQTSEALTKHIIDEAAVTAALKEQGHNVESDYHSIREQLWRIADHTGAPRVAEPPHVTTERTPHP